MSKRLIILLFFLLYSALIQASIPESIQFRHLTVQDGLSHNEIYRIAQDEFGFIWIATRDGLNKFDGYNFEVFKHNELDSTSLINNDIQGLIIDSEGLIWLRTKGELCYYNPQNNQFYRIKNHPNYPAVFSNDEIVSITKGPNGSIWFATMKHGIYKFDKMSDTFIHFSESDTSDVITMPKYFTSYFNENQRHLWMGSQNGGLYLIDTLNKTQSDLKYHDKYSKLYDVLSDKTVLNVFEDGNGNLWIGTFTDGLYRFDVQSGELSHYQYSQKLPGSFNDKGIRYIFEDSKDRCWFGTLNGGVNVFQPSTETFLHFTHNPLNKESLSHSTVTCIFEDQAGLIWIGTSNGLNIYDLNESPFTHYVNEVDNPNSIPNNLIYTLIEDTEGMIWIGTDGGGLSRLDPKKNQFTHFKHDPNNQYSISGNKIISSCMDKQGQLWFGTFLSGLNRYRKDDNTFKSYYYKDTNGLIEYRDWFRAIFEDSEGNFWAGIDNSLFIFDIEREIFHSSIDGLPIPVHSPVRCIKEDRHKNIWIGTIEGLYCYNLKEKQFSRFNLLGTTEVRVIFEDSKDRIWVGTSNYGLGYIDMTSDILILYKEEDGLPSNAVQGIEEDDHGNLWISTYLGLSKFDSEQIKFQNFNSADGLQNLYVHNATLKSKEGRLYFGGNNGLDVFHPDSIHKEIDLLPVVMNRFTIQFKSVPIAKSSPLTRHINFTRSITLNHQQSTIGFDFVSPYFSKTNKLYYAYRLLGLEEEWNYIGQHSIATFSNLPAGLYTFEVKVSHDNETWPQTSTSIGIRIKPAPWKTWWAYGLYIIIILGIIYVVFRILLWQQKLKNDLVLEKKNHELDLLKMQFLSNISHEIKTPLTLIKLPLEKLLSRNRIDEEDKKAYTCMNRNLKRILYLVNQIMDFRKIDAGQMKLDPCLGEIVTFVKNIFNTFTQIAQDKKIDYKFKSNTDSAQIFFDRDKLEKILYNLLSNAFKFIENNGNILVSFYINSQNIQLIVEDDGIGIPEEKCNFIFNRFYQVDHSITRRFEGSGIGLAYVKELVDLHHGKIEIESKYRYGSKFTVTLPIESESEHNKDSKLETLDNFYLGIEKVNDDSLDVCIVDQDENELLQETKPSILIIEDNRELLKFISHELAVDYKIVEAENGESGLQKAKSQIPDLVISDIMMPKMDGLELCQKIKNDPMTCHIPVILLTARGAVDQQLEGFQVGADDYITKPFNFDILMAKTKNIIDSRISLKEQFKQNLSVQPKDIIVTKQDELFLEKALDIVEEHMSDPSFDAEMFASELCISRSKLFLKLKGLTGQTVNDFIRTLRLKRSVQLLQSGKTVTEVSYELCFSAPTHFSSHFRKLFGDSPKEFIKSLE